MIIQELNHLDENARDSIVATAIRLLMHRAHENAINKGWWQKRDEIQSLCDDNGLGEECRKLQESHLIALTHSELSEGLEGLRKNLEDDHIPEFLMIEAELADAAIRIFDHAAKYGYDLAGAILAKMRYNQGRPHLHGGKAF